MSQNEILKSVLLNNYLQILKKLAAKVKSIDLAGDLLHDLYVKISEIKLSEPIKQPEQYLFRMAFNLIADHRRSVQRSNVSLADHHKTVETLFTITPEDNALGRIELARLVTALEELPPRRREIFMAARLEGLPYKIIAENYGVSVDTVDRDITLALDHCSRRLGIFYAKKRRNSPGRSSYVFRRGKTVSHESSNG